MLSRKTGISNPSRHNSLTALRRLKKPREQAAQAPADVMSQLIPRRTAIHETVVTADPGQPR